MTERMTHVLVVDDDRAIRETLRAALQDEAYVVSEAGDGKQALNLLQAARTPYVVLLDLRMPVMDGIKVLGVVADDETMLARHKFVAITANVDLLPAARRATRGRFALPALPKPFDLDEVFRCVDRCATMLHGGQDESHEQRPSAHS